VVVFIEWNLHCKDLNADENYFFPSIENEEAEGSRIVYETIFAQRRLVEFLTDKLAELDVVIREVDRMIPNIKIVDGYQCLFDKFTPVHP
jgi:hypothetical protein